MAAAEKTIYKKKLGGNRIGVRGGIRRGGLTPALAPSMPVYRNYRGCGQIEAVNATALPRGTLRRNQ